MYGITQMIYYRHAFPSYKTYGCEVALMVLSLGKEKRIGGLKEIVHVFIGALMT